MIIHIRAFIYSTFQSHLGHVNGLRYPSESRSLIPAENFDLVKAETAIDLAKQIVAACKAIVFEE